MDHYIRISLIKFLDTFWPIPADGSTAYKTRSRLSTLRTLINKLKNIVTDSGGKTLADLLVRLCHPPTNHAMTAKVLTMPSYRFDTCTTTSLRKVSTSL